MFLTVTMQLSANNKNSFLKGGKEKKNEMDENKYMHLRSYTIVFKLEAVAQLDELNRNISTTAKFFKIPYFFFSKTGINRAKFTNI